MALLNGKLCIAVYLSWLTATPFPPIPAPVAETEYSVKAAFLLNFTRFIQWPASAFESPQSPIRLCILGDDPFDGVLDRVVEDESVGGRRLEIVRLRKPPGPKACQMLFVSAAEKDVRRTLSGLGPGILTVGESPAFLDDGGMIAFVLENRRVRFDIRQSAAVAAGLSISSRMLSVARSVHK